MGNKGEKRKWEQAARHGLALTLWHQARVCPVASRTPPELAASHYNSPAAMAVTEITPGMPIGPF